MNMKAWTIGLSILMGAGVATASQYVKSYQRKDGTYVKRHTKSQPDPYRYNNRGSQSNGGGKRDEFSSGTGATNKSNGSYHYRDNDRDGVPNLYDKKPDSKKGR